MKALTLTQPWATLVAIGAKEIETRSWMTSYRGPIAIHAAKSFPGSAKRVASNDPICRQVLLDAGYFGRDELPLGEVVAIVRLQHCIRTEEVPTLLDGLLGRHELHFGDFSAGRYAWLLKDVQRLIRPIPVTGSLGLWHWEPHVDLERALGVAR